jgi:hypothetical protein
VNLPASLLSIGGNPFVNCTSLTAITVNAANPSYKAGDGQLLTKDGTTLIGYPSASGALTLNGVTSIGAYAFTGCTALASVDLPAAASIGAYAFDDCTALTTVDLPAAASIGDNAFWSCIALTSVDLPAAVSIGTDAFRNTGTQSLAITLGGTPPSVGTNMFSYVNSAKNVRVKVPSDAPAWNGKTGTFIGEDAAGNWGNAFRGGGWDGIDYLGGTVNGNISLTIETYTP